MKCFLDGSRKIMKTAVVAGDAVIGVDGVGVTP